MDTLEQAGVEMDPEELEHMQTMGTPIHINIHFIQLYSHKYTLYIDLQTYSIL
jgi:hypothetical protein